MSSFTGNMRSSRRFVRGLQTNQVVHKFTLCGVHCGTDKKIKCVSGNVFEKDILHAKLFSD